MKKTDPVYVAIANWFNGKRDYDEGVDLYAKHGLNKNMKALFPGHSNRYQRKLEYEMTKIIGIDFHSLDRKPVPVAPVTITPAPINIKGETGYKPESAMEVVLPAYDAEEPVERNSDDMQHLPKVIKRLMYEYHDCYEKRTRTHIALKLVEGSSKSKNAERADLLDQIAVYSARMDKLQLAKKAWETSGIVPDESTLWAMKPAQVVLNKAELRAKKLNLQKTLSKDQNLLDYQSKIKGKEPKPMPAGPKRDAIVTRMKEKEKEIAQINKAINDIDQAQ